jgi:hypothetical protein
MENFHLPIIEPEKVRSPKKAEISERKAERPLRAFLNERYPLSREGEDLKERMRSAINEGDTSEIEACQKLTPTVECPRLEIFEDFQLPPEELRRILFEDLENVQVSKGCRHQCTYCGAEAGKKVTFMPFAAILKIAEIRKPFLERKLEAWQTWTSIIKEKTGVDVTGGLYGFNGDQLNILKEEFKNFPERDLLLKRGGPDEDHSPRSWELDVRRTMSNYFDSDPFDYRDSAFLHEDGAVADYGDVFNALASEAAPIHITTAGWPINDKVAQRAAEKIVESCKVNPRLLSGIRISVKKYEVMARRDLGKYLRDMENVLRTLNPIEPQVLFYYDETDPEDSEFIEKVVVPLRSLMKQISTSKLQGRDKGLPFYKDAAHDGNLDLMACMPGIHLWPDGTIARQADPQWIPQKDNPSARSFMVPNGSRPTPTGKKLFASAEKEKD